VVKIPVPTKNSEGSSGHSSMNSKRKGRGGGNTLGRGERGHGGGGGGGNKQSKSPEKEVNHTPPPLDKESSPGEFAGVYRNARFTWALTSLIGVPLRVFTSANDEFEGILKTFSPELEIVLEQSHKIDHANEDTVNHKSIVEKHVFPLKDIVRYYAKDVDMEYAMKESFKTETQIRQTRLNGEAVV
jgi:small nuclear ribonucleoprotein (snRNP)-like protein